MKYFKINTKNRFEKSYDVTININKLYLNNSWLAGFIDAEGCFIIKTEANNTVKLIFEISQKEEEILLNIKELLGVTTKIRKCDNKKGEPYWKLSIYSKANRSKLIDYLTNNPLRSHKLEIYKKWIKANEIILNKSNKNYKEEIKELSKCMKNTKIYLK